MAAKQNVKRKRHQQAACWFLYLSEKNQALRKIIYVKEIIVRLLGFRKGEVIYLFKIELISVHPNCLRLTAYSTSIVFQIAIHAVREYFNLKWLLVF